MDEKTNEDDLSQKYLKRIQELEKENLDLFKAFEGVQRENDLLRKKYEKSSSGDIINEPYDIVNAERTALKEKVALYKQRIRYLEGEKGNTLYSLPQKLRKSELKVLDGITSVIRERVIVISGMDSVKIVKEENKVLNEKIEYLDKERRRLERKVKKLETYSRNDPKQNLAFVTNKGTGIKSKPDRYLKRPNNGYCTNGSLMFKTFKQSEALPVISSQSTSPQSLFGSDYVSLYRRRLSMMSSKKSLTNFSRSSSEV